MTSPWLGWIQQLQGIAQTGLYYKNHPFDLDRYEQVQAIAAAMLAAQSQADPALVLDLFQQDVGHATPKVDVRGVAFRDRKILLVQESSDGLWAAAGPTLATPPVRPWSAKFLKSRASPPRLQG